MEFIRFIKKEYFTLNLKHFTITFAFASAFSFYRLSSTFLSLTMLLSSLRTLVLLLLLSLSGCCNLADCDEPFGYVKLRLLKDGQNVLFGPDALITRDSLRHYTLSGLSEFEEYIDYWDSLELFGIYIDENHPSILQIGTIRTDTFSITTEAGPKGHCGCMGYEVTSVLRNGEVICTGVCEEVIEVEI